MNSTELNISSYSNKGKKLIENLKLNEEKDIMKWQILNSRNIQNLIINFAYFNPRTKNELKEAIKLWNENKEKAIKKYGDINTWNVSNITDMSNLFSFSDFNDNINDWDVSNVINMEAMFSYCYEFNQPLNKWDVSNVKYRINMFYKCKLISKHNLYKP